MSAAAVADATGGSEELLSKFTLALLKLVFATQQRRIASGQLIECFVERRPEFLVIGRGNFLLGLREPVEKAAVGAALAAMVRRGGAGKTSEPIPKHGLVIKAPHMPNDSQKRVLKHIRRVLLVTTMTDQQVAKQPWRVSRMKGRERSVITRSHALGQRGDG
jgi:hypothetical protein